MRIIPFQRPDADRPTQPLLQISKPRQLIPQHGLMCIHINCVYSCQIKPSVHNIFWFLYLLFLYMQLQICIWYVFNIYVFYMYFIQHPLLHSKQITCQKKIGQHLGTASMQIILYSASGLECPFFTLWSDAEQLKHKLLQHAQDDSLPLEETTAWFSIRN